MTTDSITVRKYEDERFIELVARFSNARTVRLDKDALRSYPLAEKDAENRIKRELHCQFYGEIADLFHRLHAEVRYNSRYGESEGEKLCEQIQELLLPEKSVAKQAPAL